MNDKIGDNLQNSPSSSSAPCVVTVSSESPQWGSFMQGRDDATIYHDPRWGEVMLQAYGNKPLYVTATRDGNVVGAVLLVRQKSMLFGSHLCSVPYFDAAGLLADDSEVADALIHKCGQLRDEAGVDWAELRQLQPLQQPGEQGIPVRSDKVTMWMDIPQGAEAMWSQLKTKVRTKVRKTRKGDLTVDDGNGEELLDGYFEAYSRTMRDLGSPSHSKKFFRLIAQTFGEAVRFFVVRNGQQVLAGSLVLIDAWGLHVPWSGSDVRFRNQGGNRLLYWSMLAYAADNGCARFDFGRSTPDSGTYGFKKEWGAEPVELYWHYLMPAGAKMPGLRPDSPKYRFLVARWKKLPLGISRLLGPRLISKLS